LILPGAVGGTSRHVLRRVFRTAATWPMPAPVLLLESSGGGTFAALYAQSGAEPPAIDIGDPAGLLEYGADPRQRQSSGVLEPGESVMVPGLLCWHAAGEWLVESVGDHVLLRSAGVHHQRLRSGRLVEPAIRLATPPSLSAAAWGSIYGNLTSQLGTTWGGYVQMLDNEAAYLGISGEYLRHQPAMAVCRPSGRQCLAPLNATELCDRHLAADARRGLVGLQPPVSRRRSAAGKRSAARLWLDR